LLLLLIFLVVLLALLVSTGSNADKANAKMTVHAQVDTLSRIQSNADLLEACVGVNLGLDSKDGLEQLLEDSLAVLGECSLNLDALLRCLDFHTLRCLIR
jgi:hypothetical protein